jgi:integration host factor subunit beta
VPHFKPGKALREAVDAKTAELGGGKEARSSKP